MQEQRTQSGCFPHKVQFHTIVETLAREAAKKRFVWLVIGIAAWSFFFPLFFFILESLIF